MGKISMIVVVGFAVIVGIVGTAMNKRTNDAQKKNMSVFEQAQARNIAKSATHIYARALKRDSTLNGTFPLNLLAGTATVQVSEKTPGVRKDLIFGVVGNYGQAIKTVSLNAVKTDSPPLSVTGAFSVSRNAIANISCTGAGSIVDGNNYNPTTGALDNSLPAVDGISMEDRSDLTYAGGFNMGNIPVTGARGGPTPPDTAALGTAQPDFNSLPGQLIPLATITITTPPGAAQTWGTHASPAITHVNNAGSISKPITGEGILILSGKMSFTNTFSWKGIIIIVGNAVPANQFASITNVNSFYGAVILTGPNVSFKQSNNGFYRYSKQAIKDVWNTLGVSGSGSSNYTLKNWRE